MRYASGNYGIGRSLRLSFLHNYDSESSRSHFRRRYGRNFRRRRFTNTERLFERMLPTRGDHETSDEEDDEPVPECLKVEDVDFKIIKNTKKHMTDRFEITAKTNDLNQKQEPKLVLRRGYSFTVVIRFNKEYKADSDKVTIQFAFSDRPKLAKGTLVRLELTDTFKENEWAAVLKNVKGSEIQVEIHTPATIHIGVWRMRVNIKIDETKVTQTAPYEFIMLFNPFDKQDEVYMANDNERQEYVMNEVGKLYVGTEKQIYGRSWNFGQFQGKVLECVLYLLDAAELLPAARKSAVKITRKLTAMINSSDDNGVLMGNWSGNYTDGRSPLDWTGSEEIFVRYYESKKTVKYGQCWVFSGVLTTALRALGIPARSVTNFRSAHDTDGSITIDDYYNQEGERQDFMSDDSIWNFHVWNECHMVRNDLPEGYGGWQACDSTPQETSEGIYCCGPCPVKAIRLGDVSVKYDAPFIFAEVNADQVHWVRMTDGSYTSVVNNNGVGRNISTKSVLKSSRNDITLDYKGEEGTASERIAVMRAVESAGIHEKAYNRGPEDMKFEIDINLDTMIGSDLVVKLKMENTSGGVRHVEGKITASSVYYTGVLAHKVKAIDIQSTVQPKSKGVTDLVVVFDDYFKYMVDHCGVHLTVMTLVTETKQYSVLEENFRFRKPDIKLKAPATACLKRPFDVEISFGNPLKVPLTNCVLTIGGPSLQKTVSHPQPNVDAGGTFYTAVKITPSHIGEHTICVGFGAQELAGLEQMCDIEIKEN